MSGGPDPLGWFARRSHPRLAALVLIGAATGLVGVLLAVAGAAGTLGLRVAVVGALVFFFGASGYVAFAVFERGFE